MLVWDLDETLIVFQSLARDAIGRRSLASLHKVCGAASGNVVDRMLIGVLQLPRRSVGRFLQDTSEAARLSAGVEATIFGALDRGLTSPELEQDNPPHVSLARFGVRPPPATATTLARHVLTTADTARVAGDPAFQE